MVCPRCNLNRLTENADGSQNCCCGLRRRPPDKTMVRKDTNHYVLKRNIARTPPGSVVELVRCSDGYTGILGAFTGDADHAIRSGGLIIAYSRDIEDLVILIFEHQWKTNSVLLNEALQVLRT